MKNVKFYTCPACGKMTVSENGAEISCCGSRLEPIQIQKPDQEHTVALETVEDEWLASLHPMNKKHYISMVALTNGERLEVVRTYAERELQVRFFKRGHGRLFWVCSEHGLFSRLFSRPKCCIIRHEQILTEGRHAEG